MKTDLSVLQNLVNTINKPTLFGIIYSFYCIPEDMYYIGVTKHMITKPPKIGSISRFNSHIWSLRNNKHSKKMFQEHYNKHLDQAFEFTIIEAHPLYDLYSWDFILDNEVWWHDNLPNLYSSVNRGYYGLAS